MTHEFSHELISAYLDREATDAERAEIERRVRDRADDRQLLADFGRLSRELQSLPRKECPAEFYSGVMRAVEAGRLEPVPDHAADVARPSVWLRNFAALTVTAAALVLAMIVLNPRTVAPDPSVASHTPLDRVNSPGSTAADDPSRENRVVGFRSDPKARDEGGKQSAETLVAGSRRAFAATGFGGGRTDPLVPAIPLQDKKAGDGRNARDLVFIDDLRKLSGDDVGRVLTAIEHTPRGISVVKLTVIDCGPGLDRLQLLLSRNRIHLQPGEAKADARSKRGPERLVAVYVRSSPDRLVSVMSDLKADRQFRRLQVDPPISPLRFDSRTRYQIAMLDDPESSVPLGKAADKGSRRFQIRGSQHLAKKNSAGGTTGNKLSGGDARPKDGTATVRRGKSAKSDSSGKTAVAEWDRISKQLHLTIPADAFRRKSPVAIAQGNRGKSKPSPTITAGVTPKAAVRPLRVLFVLVCPPKVQSP